MLQHNWIQLGLIVVTIIVGIILHMRYKRKLRELDGFVGFVEEHGESERLEGIDWQTEAYKELEKLNARKPRKHRNK